MMFKLQAPRCTDPSLGTGGGLGDKSGESDLPESGLRAPAPSTLTSRVSSGPGRPWALLGSGLRQVELDLVGWA